MVPRACQGNKAVFADMVKLHEFFRQPEQGLPVELFDRATTLLGHKKGITRRHFLNSEEAWNRVCEDYLQFCTDPSFVDYFWTVRTMHAPLFTLADIARTFPPAKVYHSVSTGYAGLLGVLLSKRHNCPYVITEHGIYTKERRIDLAHAEWIKEFHETFGGGLDERVSYIRRVWINFFEGIGRLAYTAADPIIALFEGNRHRQVSDGAPEEKTRSIPNGIDIDRFAPLRDKRPKQIPMVLGLIGRVVPIKDIRTFIRAMRNVCSALPAAEGWIVGPDDEDPDYAKECKDLVLSLDLEGKVKFLGFQKMDEMLPQIGLMILTSISEGLPLVILEAYAAGLPVVATDVGSCRELIEGQTGEDRALGPSGRVVPIANPEATAEASLELLTNAELWQSAQQAAIQRVERYYNEPLLFANYRSIYGGLLEDYAGRDRLRAS